MKIPLILIFLFFSSPLLADDISDFQIEGMSIGDSLLDYYNEREILNNQEEYNKENKFKTSEFQLTDKSSEYHSVGVYYKNNDNKYIIHGVSGGIFYINNIENCYSKKNNIVNDLSILLKNTEWENNEIKDVDGYFLFDYAYLKSGIVEVSCYDWNNELEMKGWTDHLKVRLLSNELNNWINSIDTIYSD